MQEKNFVLTNKFKFNPDQSNVALQMEKARSRNRIANNIKAE